MSRRRPWSHSEGEKGWTVTVYERRPGGPLYARAFDPKLRGGKGGYRRISLGHRDRELAKTYALEQAAKLRAGLSELATGKVSLVRLMSEYLMHHSPRKSAGQRKQDERRAKLWARLLGAKKDPHAITLGEWHRFIDLRGSGAIGPDGKLVPPEKRRPVRARAVEADLKWLRWVLNWGTRWRDHEGHYLLRENAVRGYEIPSEKNPRRPVATEDRYHALRAVSDQVPMEVRWDGHRRIQRSYLSELLVLANGTARRISAICQVRYEDLRLSASPGAPHGAIRWPEDTDKEGREWVAPITPEVRAALDRALAERPGIGAAYLFPSPEDPTRPINKDLARKWLQRAESLAKLPKQQRGGWHSYRRKWATERKRLPLADVAQAGGWKSKETLLSYYQQADEASILRVVLGGDELRELKA